eukprot:571464-Amphidinium_carterae.1
MRRISDCQGIVLASSESTTFSGRDFAQHTARIREPLVAQVLMHSVGTFSALLILSSAQVQDLRSAIVREAAQRIVNSPYQSEGSGGYGHCLRPAAV